MSESSPSVPKRFWAYAALFLIWNLMGVSNFFQHVTSAEEMNPAEQILLQPMPLYTIFFFFFAVFGGLAGSMGLFLRNKVALYFFYASFIGVIGQLPHFLSIGYQMGGDEGNWVFIMNGLLLIIAILAITHTRIGIANNWLK